MPNVWHWHNRKWMNEWMNEYMSVGNRSGIKKWDWQVPSKNMAFVIWLKMICDFIKWTTEKRI